MSVVFIMHTVEKLPTWYRRFYEKNFLFYAQSREATYTVVSYLVEVMFCKTGLHSGQQKEATYLIGVFLYIYTE